MLRSSSLPFLLVAVPFCHVTGAAAASEYELIELDSFVAEFVPNLSGPILDAAGVAYWTARNDLDDADLLFRDPGGQIDSVADLPPGAAGDAPLFIGPTDERNGSLLLSGKFLVPADGGGFMQTSAYYTSPGFTRIVDYTTPVEGFPNDPIFTVPEHPPLFDADGSIVFLMRDGTNFSDLHYAICRLVGTTVTKLVEEDVTPVPGGGAAFSRVLEPTVSDGVILFYGEGGGRRGVYQLASGSITTVVDDQSVLPGKSSPVPILDSSDVAFANDGSDVVIGLRQTGGGVWKRVAGTWSLVALQSDPMPRGSGIFYDFPAVAIRDGIAAFMSRRDNAFLPPRDSGIYTDDGGHVRAVASLLGDFEAEAFLDFYVAEGGRWFDGADVVFALRKEVEGAYYRAVPEPAAALAWTAAITSLCVLRRRRSSDTRGARGGAPSTR